MAELTRAGLPCPRGNRTRCAGLQEGARSWCATATPPTSDGRRTRRSRPSRSDPSETSTAEPCRLRDNRADYAKLQTRGVPRDGAALLHGIIFCGECGHKMVVRYKHGSQYVCDHLQRQQGTPACQVLRAAGIDARVAAAFLEAVTPTEMDAWSEARRVECQVDTALRRAQEQQVERLRYQASLAERQFNRVDPDNRLVAAELERRWEVALVELRHAETALAQRDQEDARRAEPSGLDPVLRVQALALGERLPALWADPGVSGAHRKALLRCLVDKVVLRRTARHAACVRVVWRGGAVSELTVALPVSSFAALPRGPEMEARVLERPVPACTMRRSRRC